MPEIITDNVDLWTSALLTKSTAGRGSNGKLEAYGIKKLRELILELAVRGKLVPQDSNEEPASVLLEKISHEKARLNKEGRIRKQEKQPSITDSEQPFCIPSGWEWVRLGDVVEVVRGITFPASEKSRDAEEGRVACLRTTNVQDRIEWDDLLYVRREFVTRDEQFVRTSDIVMSTANSRELVGKVAIVEKEPELQAAFGGFLTVLRPILLAPSFVMVLLRTPVSRNALIDSASQTTNIANISIGKLNPLFLAIPPLAEQHRIVAKVDELMALCDQLEQQQTDALAAHQTLVETLLGTLTRVESQREFSAVWARIANHFDNLFTTEASIDQLKQTILQLAVMGRLVLQDPNDESATVLLEEIATEKARLVEEGKIKREKQPTDITTAVEPFDIPERWAWTDLSQLLALVTDGDHQAPPQSQEGVPFLVIGNLNTGKINFDGCKYVPIDYYEKLDWVRKPVAGDLLYTVTGSFGIPVRVDTREQFCVQRHVAILKATDSTPRRYLELVLGSKYAIDYAATIATGIAQKTVPLTGLRRMQIPVAPNKEQHRIVAKVDELMALCDTLKARLADTQTTQLHLADAIVEQAVC